MSEEEHTNEQNDLYRPAYANDGVPDYYDDDEFLLVFRHTGNLEEAIPDIQRSIVARLRDSVPGLELVLSSSPITFPIDTVGDGNPDQISVVAGEIKQPHLAAQQVITALKDALKQEYQPIGAAQLIDAIPNLLIGSAGNIIVKGGPGSRAFPAPIPNANRTGFFMAQDDIGQLGIGENGNDTIVAILDAFPDLTSERIVTLSQTQPLLHDVLQNAHVLGDVPGVASLGAHKPRAGHRLEDREEQPWNVIVDHGLFVAGIVHSIAPGAELCLIRVLNANGVGDLRALNAALKHVMHLATTSGKRLVINCSLVLAIQPGQEEMGGLIHLLKLASLLTVQNSQPSSRFCIVAAAGNDSDDAGYPAAFNSVVGVAALDRTGEPAPYTNKADSHLGDPRLTYAGVATFGGRDSSGADGMIGIYTAPSYPDGTLNTSGWAYWSGTSFAAPVISALIARGLSQTGQPIADVLATMGIVAAPPPATAGVAVAMVGQVLKVWQGSDPLKAAEERPLN